MIGLFLILVLAWFSLASLIVAIRETDPAMATLCSIGCAASTVLLIERFAG